jgi:hypothetical protein
MIEYGSFYYLNEKILGQVKNVLCAPETPTHPRKAAMKILDILIKDKMQDEAKIVLLLEGIVDPDLLWSEVEPNLNFFAQDIIFDGGFRLGVLFNEGCKKEDFLDTWDKQIPHSLRKIRNALVHSREARQVDVIAPNPENYRRLQHLIPLIRLIAAQVAINLEY